MKRSLAMFSGVLLLGLATVSNAQAPGATSWPWTRRGTTSRCSSTERRSSTLKTRRSRTQASTACGRKLTRSSTSTISRPRRSERGNGTINKWREHSASAKSAFFHDAQDSVASQVLEREIDEV